MNPLLEEEHLLLGAHIESSGDRARVLHYGSPADELEAISEGAALVDLGGTPAWRVSGDDAQGFVRAAFAGWDEAVGECGFQAVLLGDGSLASVPFLARTGTMEYVCWDPTPREAVLDGWLSFLASVEQDGVRAFPRLQVEDVTEALSPLLLVGPAAETVLADYVADPRRLPAPQRVCELDLDRIHALVIGLSLAGQRGFVALVPPSFVRVLWRSLLSFTEVVPLGDDGLRNACVGTLPWAERILTSTDKVRLGGRDLLRWGLVRPEGGYVGERGLTDLADKEDR